MSQHKKCKETKGEVEAGWTNTEKDCVCNTNLCNRDASGAGATGGAGLLATVLLAVAMARI